MFDGRTVSSTGTSPALENRNARTLRMRWQSSLRLSFFAHGERPDVRRECADLTRSTNRAPEREAAHRLADRDLVIAQVADTEHVRCGLDGHQQPSDRERGGDFRRAVLWRRDRGGNRKDGVANGESRIKRRAAY